jgi:hypothetical protein
MDDRDLRARVAELSYRLTRLAERSRRDTGDRDLDEIEREIRALLRTVLARTGPLDPR